MIYIFISQLYNVLQVEKEIGERRVISFHGAGLSVGPKVDFHVLTAAFEDPEEVSMFAVR